MSWLLVLGTAWVVLAAPLALVVGRAIRLRDQLESRASCRVVPDFVPEHWAAPTAGTR
jgi:hypothetical protein